MGKKSASAKKNQNHDLFETKYKFEKKLLSNFILKKKLLQIFLRYEDEYYYIDEESLYNEMKAKRLKSNENRRMSQIKKEKRTSTFDNSKIKENRINKDILFDSSSKYHEKFDNNKVDFNFNKIKKDIYFTENKGLNHDLNKNSVDNKTFVNGHSSSVHDFKKLISCKTIDDLKDNLNIQNETKLNSLAKVHKLFNKEALMTPDKFKRIIKYNRNSKDLSNNSTLENIEFGKFVNEFKNINDDSKLNFNSSMQKKVNFEMHLDFTPNDQKRQSYTRGNLKNKLSNEYQTPERPFEKNPSKDFMFDNGIKNTGQFFRLESNITNSTLNNINLENSLNKNTNKIKHYYKIEKLNENLIGKQKNKYDFENKHAFEKQKENNYKKSNVILKNVNIEKHKFLVQESKSDANHYDDKNNSENGEQDKKDNFKLYSNCFSNNKFKSINRKLILNLNLNSQVKNVEKKQKDTSFMKFPTNSYNYITSGDYYNSSIDFKTNYTHNFRNSLRNETALKFKNNPNSELQIDIKTPNEGLKSMSQNNKRNQLNTSKISEDKVYMRTLNNKIKGRSKSPEGKDDSKSCNLQFKKHFYNQKLNVLIKKSQLINQVIKYDLRSSNKNQDND